MFRTKSNYEVQIPLHGLFGDVSGVQHWQAFELTMQDYYFLVEFLVQEDDEMSRWMTVFLSELESVLDLILQPFVLEHRVNLYIPSHQSKSKQIELKPIISIFSAIEFVNYSKNNISEQKVFIYVASDGTHYLSNHTHGLEEDLKDKCEVYSKANIDVRHD